MVCCRLLSRCGVGLLLINAAVTGLATPAQASSADCDGTQLELSLREQDASPAVGFRFSLAVLLDLRGLHWQNIVLISNLK